MNPIETLTALDGLRRELHCQREKIACLEEIAYDNGWITHEDLARTYETYKKNQYGDYLKKILDRKYIK